MTRDVRICGANGRVRLTYVYTCVNFKYMLEENLRRGV